LSKYKIEYVFFVVRCKFLSSLVFVFSKIQ